MLKYFVAVLLVAIAILMAPQTRKLLETNILDRAKSFMPAAWTAQASVRLLNEDELALYNGEPGSRGLYLSILGQVFDVGKGRKHYGPGGAYHFFAGRDASRAFVTGDFTEAGLVDDITGLSPTEMVVLFDWLSLYKRDYVPVGRLVGRFYSEVGEPTAALQQAQVTLAQGLELKAQAEEESQQFPSCNSEWRADRGGRVWCSTQSGGVLRGWAGVPRKLFKPGSSSSRCVCVQVRDLASPRLQEYEGCPPVSESCAVGS
ncbi:neuferricin [Lepisosteus oculatus]|uniref:neuferricin n=1 Tax=Lepisosteus oculatus TaxID=7918 RepID=UPI00371BC678